MSSEETRYNSMEDTTKHPNGEKNNRKAVPFSRLMEGAFGLFLLALLLMVVNGRSATETITQGRFESLFRAGAVRSLTLIPNANRVEITLTPKVQATLLRGDGLLRPEGPHYSFPILGREFFERDLAALQSASGQAIPYTVRYQSAVGGYTTTWALTAFGFLLAVLAWLGALVRILRHPFPTLLSKAAWLLLVLLLPVVGTACYWLSRLSVRKASFS